jgi:hypothetical protein
VTRFGDGWVALGSGGLPDDEELVLDVLAFSSPDGRSWSEVDAVGFEGQADVTGVAAVHVGLVGVGALRTADDPTINTRLERANRCLRAFGRVNSARCFGHSLRYREQATQYP